MIEMPFLHAYIEIVFGRGAPQQETYHKKLKYPFRHHIRSTGYDIFSFCKKIENTKGSVSLLDVFNE
ncbi:hypothetical protein SJI19_05155 [Acerihabitans sp. TG2]|uniref:hypothetical protein n=1 Tax=Acerihabitans sp. TG2 TaxID=3096008 RepID=UPI002B22D848|nr:hypothetical protein [Acerihabitans sp. TG2]MEA9389945.1 hypothetical protein [Acerihabitans sp. TG2]